MKLHELKIKSEYFSKIRCGLKTFELRKNDRDYQEGDLIHFVKINGENFSKAKTNLFKITYVLKNVPEYGLDKNYCILGIKLLKD